MRARAAIFWPWNLVEFPLGASSLAKIPCGVVTCFVWLLRHQESIPGTTITSANSL